MIDFPKWKSDQSADRFLDSKAEPSPRTHNRFYLQLQGGLGYLNSSWEAEDTGIEYSGTDTGLYRA
jgi:hypothetical protein